MKWTAASSTRPKKSTFTYSRLTFSHQIHYYPSLCFPPPQKDLKNPPFTLSQGPTCTEPTLIHPHGVPVKSHISLQTLLQIPPCPPSTYTLSPSPPHTPFLESAVGSTGLLTTPCTNLRTFGGQLSVWQRSTPWRCLLAETHNASLHLWTLENVPVHQGYIFILSCSYPSVPVFIYCCLQ